jgi:hypothetical protein
MRNRVSFFLTSAIVLLFCAQATATAQGQNSIVFGPEKFTRNAGQPQVITRTFSIQDLSQNHTLIIQSGLNGENRVSSAVVKLNGIIVAAPSDFNQQTGLILKPVSLQHRNTVSVELRGQPNAFLVVTIRQGIISETPQLTIINNRTDPLVLRVETVDGKIIDYFGVKDDEGIVTSLYAVRVQDAAGGVSTIFLDEQSRPIRIEAANGVVFELNWLTDTSIALTAIAPNGAQIDVPVDLATGTAGHHAASSVMIPAIARQNFRLNNFTPILARQILTQARQSVGTSFVTVRHCAAPVGNASVKLEIYDKKGFVESVPYRPLGNGFYSVSVPAADPGADNRLGDRLCFAIANVLDKLCTVVELLGPAFPRLACPAIAVAIDFLLGGPTGEGFAIYAACQSILPPALAAIEETCNTVGFSPGMGAPNVASYLCQFSRVLTNRITRGKPTYVVKATIPGVAGSQTEILGTPVNGIFPQLTLTFPCQCASGFGKSFLINEDNTNVRVTILPFEGIYTNEIRLFYRGQSILIGTNRDVGRVVNLGQFDAGEELVFGIVVRETGHTFRMGPGFRNPDRYAHARVDCLPDGVKVSFEDNFLGEGDRDFDDAVFRITTSR